MILAAAIKYKINGTGETVVLCGARHGDVYAQLHPLGLKSTNDYEEIEDGFIDHHNNFLTRKEAFEHAKQCGQLSSKIIYEREHNECVGGTNLISEDLY